MAGMQDKDIYKRPYVRPNEKWVCGLSDEGTPCPRGPSKRGKCVSRFECEPAKVGDRWICTRPDQYGGPCDDPSRPEPSFGPHVIGGQGVCCRPVHCTPKRTLRARRGLVSIVFCMLIAGIVLVGVGGPWRNHFLSPGPLTAAHQGASMASLETMSHGRMDAGAAGLAESDGCQICHTAAGNGLSGMLASSTAREARVSQSQQCLQCHGDDLGESALFTHALDPDFLARHTARAESEHGRPSKPLSMALASLSPGVPTGPDGQMACAECHREHNGALFDLKRLDNRQCQSCHVKQFDGLAEGHPEFSTLLSAAGYDYPYRRRTRIIYDHASHEKDYFQREGNRAHAPADCTACHEVGPGDRATALKPFEQMCAACHTGDIVRPGSDWIHVVGFPSALKEDFDLLEEDTGAEGLPRTTGKPLSPFMLLLLSGLYGDDPAARERFADDLRLLNDEFYGSFEDFAYDGDPETVVRMLEGLSTVYDLAMDGDSGGLRGAALELLEHIPGAELEPRAFEAMFGNPEPGVTVRAIADDVARKSVVETSGWLMREGGYRVDEPAWRTALDRARPVAALQAAAGEDGAGPFQDALDFIGDYGAFRDWFDTYFEIEGGEWRLIESGDEVGDDKWAALVVEAAGGPAAPAADDGEGEGEESEEGEGDPGGGEEGEDGPPAAAQDNSEAAHVADGALAEAGAAFMEWFQDPSQVQDWIEEEFDTSSTNWTMRAPRSLFYRPIQHADPFFTAWLDFSAALYQENRAAAMVFDELSGQATGSAVGQCMKCHSIDVEENLAGERIVQVNWKSEAPRRAFTTFNHSPHLKLMDCAQCHRAPWITEGDGQASIASALNTGESDAGEAAAAPEMSYLDSFKAEAGGQAIGVDFANRDSGAESHAFVSSFEPVTKADCARCHVPGRADDSCLICHNYHIQRTNWSAGLDSLTALLKGDAPEEAAVEEDAGAEETGEDEDAAPEAEAAEDETGAAPEA